MLALIWLGQRPDEQCAQTWTQNTRDVRDNADPGDGFGFSLAAGDFDGDGFSNLAIGVRIESVDTPNGEVDGAGAVHILYGATDRLTKDGNQLWHQASPNIWGSPGPYDHFGRSLAVGNFGDGDEFVLAAASVEGAYVEVYYVACRSA